MPLVSPVAESSNRWWSWPWLAVHLGFAEFAAGFIVFLALWIYLRTNAPVNWSVREGLNRADVDSG